MLKDENIALIQGLETATQKLIAMEKSAQINEFNHKNQLQQI